MRPHLRLASSCFCPTPLTKVSHKTKPRVWAWESSSQNAGAVPIIPRESPPLACPLSSVLHSVVTLPLLKCKPDHVMLQLKILPLLGGLIPFSENKLEFNGKSSVFNNILRVLSNVPTVHLSWRSPLAALPWLLPLQGQPWPFVPVQGMRSSTTCQCTQGVRSEPSGGWEQQERSAGGGVLCTSLHVVAPEGQARHGALGGAVTCFQNPTTNLPRRQLSHSRPPVLQDRPCSKKSCRQACSECALQTLPARSSWASVPEGVRSANQNVLTVHR